MSRSRLVACWVTTGLVASSMLSAGVAHVRHVQSERRRLRAPRLPLHFVTLGALLSPKAAT